MADPASSDAVATAARCPWCSADLPGGAGASCAACGAILTGEPERQLPGVTAIDSDAIARGARTPPPVRRSRLLSWISGDDGAEFDTPAQPGSLAPPLPDVRREMLRLEIEAEVASMQAEAEWIVSEAQADARAAAVTTETAEAVTVPGDAAAAPAVAVSASGPSAPSAELRDSPPA
ncbi:MAG TPA: hypothetical protein VGC90_07160 [Candidatus Limnocylindrales bacterium]